MGEYTLELYQSRPFDIWGLQTLAIAYNDEANKFSQLPFCEKHVYRTADKMTSAGSSAIYLLYDGDKVIGGIWVTASYAIHTTALVGYEQLTYVMPEYRGQGLSKYLAKVGSDWLIRAGCKVIQFGINSGIDGPSHPYKSLGFVPIGTNFIKFVK